MQYLKLSYNEKLEIRIFEKQNEQYLPRRVDEKDINSFLETLNKNPGFVKSLRIKENKLLFKTKDIVVELNNYKNFKHDKRFSFVFEILKKRNCKLIKQIAMKGIAVGLAAAGAISIIDYLKKNADENDFKEEEITIETTTSIDNDISNEIEVTPLNRAEVKEEKQETTTDEIKEEVTKNNYDDLLIGTRTSDEKNIKCRSLYYDTIEKYANKYGVPVEVMCAIATQERGVHSDKIDEMGAIGLMQVQVSVWNNQTLTVYDYENDKNTSINITLEKLKDVEFNIEASCCIFQHYLKKMNGNVIAAIQSYNNGDSSVRSMLNSYSNETGKSRSEILLENDLGWLKYRGNKYPGDPSYLEHVLRYFEGDVRVLECVGNASDLKK